MTSVRTVDETRPPMMVKPISARKFELAPIPKATGIMPMGRGLDKRTVAVYIRPKYVFGRMVY